MFSTASVSYVLSQRLGSQDLKSPETACFENGLLEVVVRVICSSAHTWCSSSGHLAGHIAGVVELVDDVEDVDDFAENEHVPPPGGAVGGAPPSRSLSSLRGIETPCARAGTC